MTTDMTSAEFKALRESMGLTTKWLAIRWGAAESSVKRWERNRLLPEDLAQDVRDLKRRFDALVERDSQYGPDTVLLVPRLDSESSDGMPAAWHRAAAQRASEAHGARILYLDDEQL